MELFSTGKYTEMGNFPFVEIRDPRLKKDIAYYVQKAESIYCPYVMNKCSIPSTMGDELELLRLYASDDQPEWMYKRYIKQFLEDKTTKKIGNHIDLLEAEKKSYWNVDWAINSTAQKIIWTLVGLFEGKEYNISADPIDMHSKNLVEDAEMELWALSENKDFLKAYNELAGLKHQEPDFVPESQDEMEVYKETGGFKLNYARAMEKAIKLTRAESGWTEIKKSMAADKLTCGYEAFRDYYDPEDGMIKHRYVDPGSLVIQWSEFNDHHDSNYAGHFFTMNISEVRQWIPGRPEEFYRNLAFEYCGYAGNPGGSEFHLHTGQNTYGAYGYEFFKVLIFDCEWIDVDTKHEILFKNKYGSDVSQEVEFDQKLEDFMPTHKLQDKVERFTDKRRLFGCKWIVGTGEVFDWGPSYNVAKPSKRDVSLSYHVYHYHGKPLMKRLKPVLDQRQVLWLKLQNAIAYARNSGGLFNATAIMSTAKTPEEKSEWVKRFLESGYGFFGETNAMTMRNNSMMPFFPDPGGMGKMFTDIQGAMLMNDKIIEDITGYNPISMGATPNPNAPVTTQQMSIQAMSNTLRPYISGYMTLCKQGSESITRKIQLCIKYNDFSRKTYQAKLGDMDVELMRVAEGDGVQYGIVLQPLPDDFEKQALVDQIKLAQQPSATDNTTRITASDALMLMQMLQSDQPLKNISFCFAMAEKRHMRENLQIAQAKMEKQSQLNQADANNSAKRAQEVEQQAHSNKLDQIREVNKGLVGKTVAGETIKQHGQAHVQEIKNEGKKEPEHATSE